MIVTKITDHVAQAKARLLEQYKVPKIQGFQGVFAKQIQDLEDAIYALDEGRQLWNGTNSPAVGKQLDQIGTIVGIGRNGLSDAEYLLFIFGKIASNNSDTTITTIQTIIAYLFEAQQVLFQEEFPAGIAIQVLGSPIPPSLYNVAVSIIKASLGATINLAYVGISPVLNVFRFDGPGVVGANNGFGDDLNPSVGGVWIDLI